MEISQLFFYFNEYVMHFDKYRHPVHHLPGSRHIRGHQQLLDRGKVRSQTAGQQQPPYQTGACGKSTEILRKTRTQSHLPLPVRSHRPYLRPLRGRHRHHALPYLPPLQCDRRPCLGLPLHRCRLFLREHSLCKGKLFPRSLGHHHRLRSAHRVRICKSKNGKRIRNELSIRYS